MRIKRVSYIGIDVHSSFCEGGWVDAVGKERGSFKVPTTIPTLTEAIERVPAPRKLVIEEGPLSGWLCRNLQHLVEEMVSCDAFRNALIAREGEKSDPIDWRKLVQLYRGGYTKAVHQPQSLDRSLFKQHVQLYHDRVKHRVSEGLKIIWRCRQMGVFILEKQIKDDARRVEVIDKLPGELARADIQLLLRGYDQACEQVTQLRLQLGEASKKYKMIRQLQQVPGVGLIRAATFFAIVDTPFRFKKKQKLWKYLGIGLEKRQSGKGHVALRAPKRFNHELKNVILGAAKSAAAGNNPFADQYQRWMEDGCSPRIARRNLARSLATTMWGMWKSGSVYDPANVSLEPQRLS